MLTQTAEVYKLDGTSLDFDDIEEAIVYTELVSLCTGSSWSVDWEGNAKGWTIALSNSPDWFIFYEQGERIY